MSLLFYALMFSANFAFSAVLLKSNTTKISVKPNMPLVSIPISVGGTSKTVNVPTVAVTVCVPGTNQCQTINNIKLDTGSVGLRIFKSVLGGLSLPTVLNSGSEVGVCNDFDGGGNYWGPLAKADIKFSSLTASSVPIQVVDPSFKSGSLPKTSDFHCASPIQSPTAAGANGILGVSDSLTLCSSIECTGEQYYSFGSGVSNISIANTNQSFPLSQHIQNPVASLPVNYNNGVTIVFPTVTDTGVASITGTMYLGIFVFSNNPTPSMCQTDYRSFFTSVVNGNYLWTILDSGTNANALPPTDLSSEPGLKKCIADPLNPYYCPTNGTQFTKSVTLMGASTYGSTGISCGNVDIPVQASVVNYPNNYVFSNNLRSSTNTLVLGLAFFYGKTTYFVIDGKNSVLGTGPQIGFSK